MKNNTNKLSVHELREDHFINESRELNEEGIILCAEAFILGKESLLPESVLHLLAEDETQRQEVLNFQEILEASSPHYLIEKSIFSESKAPQMMPNKSLSISWSAWGVLLMLVTALSFSALYFFYPNSSGDNELQQVYEEPTEDESKAFTQSTLPEVLEEMGEDNHMDSLPMRSNNAILTPQRTQISNITDITDQPIQQIKQTSTARRLGRNDITFWTEDENGLPLVVNPLEAKTFRLKNGTEIKIPASAFVDGSGNKIQGEVKILYREFRTPAEIIASQIPMYYYQGDKLNHFESAGMFEIRAEQDGKAVFIAPEKNLEVNMAADGSEEEGYRQYFLNESSEASNWQELRARNTSSSGSSGLNLIAAQNTLIIRDSVQLNMEFNYRKLKRRSKLYRNKKGRRRNYKAFKLPLASFNEELSDLRDHWWYWQDAKQAPSVYREYMYFNIWDSLSLTPITREHFERGITLTDLREARFSPKGRYVHGSYKGNARIWDILKGRQLDIFPRENPFIFSKNDKFLLIAGQSLEIWNLRKQELIEKINIPQEEILSMDFSPNSKYITILKSDQNVLILNKKGELLRSFSLSQHASGIAFSPDNNGILVYSPQSNGICVSLNGQEISSELDLSPEKFILKNKQLKYRDTQKATLHDFEVSHTWEISTEDTTLIKALSGEKNHQKAIFNTEGTMMILESKNHSQLWFRSVSYATPICLASIQLEDASTLPFNVMLRDLSYTKPQEADVISESLSRTQRMPELSKEQSNSEAGLMSSFRIQNFGVYNLDRIYTMQKPLALRASYSFEKEKDARKTLSLYLITGERETAVITYFPQTWKNMTFDPESRNQLVGVLPNGDVVQFRASDFAKLDIDALRENNLYRFKMTQHAAPGSVEEFDQILRGEGL